MRDLFDLSGKSAVVTGAASGLGKAIALGLASAGADVMAVDINLPGAEVTSQAIKELGRDSFALQTDVTQEGQVKEMVKQACQRFKRIDISFNIPGINVRKPALELSLAEYRRVLEVNLIGVFLCAKAVGEVMVEQRGGKMVNMSSIQGHSPKTEQAAYASSKGGVSALTKVLALEWAPYGVNVNALCPGFARTPLTEAVQHDEAFLEYVRRRVPMGRFAEPWEVVGPAMFLVSEAASFVTGVTLFVDGGLMAA